MPTLLAHVLAFAGAALLLAMAPGPATATLLRQTIKYGRRRGAATVAGIESGVLFWAVTASAGLSALLAASTVAYDVLRIVGAIVLLGLGAQALFRSRKEQQNTQLDGGESGTPSLAGRGGWSAYRAGLVTNLANPKAGVFAISFLPQFIPHGYPVLPTGLLLAAVWVICDGTWYLALTAIVHGARQLLSRGVVRQRLEALSGVALVGFGVRLALESR
ncbi:MAG TPA: LysE family translocator [Acidothermaceae bacterium]|nr:LysE family translocator [Acidothermaceae bacterium]